MKKTLLKIYALYCFALTGVALTAFVLFFENIWLEKTVSLPIEKKITLDAIFIDFGLLALFGVLHSIMARNWFKKWWTNFVPPQVERATYLLISSVCLALIVWFWQPFGEPIWDYQGTLVGYILYGFSGLGLLLIVISIFLISPKEFMGWQQLATFPEENKKRFVQPFLYQIVRHPIYFGFLLAFWSTPLLTLSHIVFTIVMTIYIIIGASLEEQNLIDDFGLTYMDYQRNVPMLIPFTKLSWFRRY